MIFLKKIEAEGFKSYATNTVINLEEEFVGIIGPNGSGKTNVVDAIRWVLGETSSKQLRSETSSDIIFYGSEAYEQSDFASVTLFFDNSKKILKNDSKEIVIKRVLKRNSDTSDYYLNNELVKRKDILNLFLDTGLSKGSLGIISQGTVQWFVEAKPEERRKIFEEAAGVGKYIKSKNDHLHQLDGVKKNLEELQISANQYRNNIKKLEIQADIAKKYLDKKNELEKYELYDSKNKYLHYKSQIDKLKNELEEANNELNDLSQNNLKNKNDLKDITIEKNIEDKKLSELNHQKYKILEDINSLTQQKSIYEINLKNQLNSSDKKVKINALKENISNLEIELKNWNSENVKFSNQLNKLNIDKNNLLINKNKKELELKNIQNEYNDILGKKLYIEQLINNEYRNEEGIKTLLNNRNIIPGLIDPLNKLIKKILPEHITAVDLALGKNIHTLVVNSVNDARLGIEFLKKNKSGVASFMPLDGIKSYDLPYRTITIAKNFDGFINTADKLIEIDELYYPVVKSLIGNILIVNNLQSANLLAKAIDYSSRIISLEGDIINRGGMIIGGNNKRISTLNTKDKYQEILDNIEEIKNKFNEINNEYNLLINKEKEVNNNINTLFINGNSIKDHINNITNEINKSKSELSSLNVDNNNDNDLKFDSNILTKKITELETKKNEIVSKFSVQEKICENYNKDYEELTELVNNQSELILNLTTKKNQIENNITNGNNMIEKCIAIANKYKYTIETIIEEIQDISISEFELQQKIQSLKSTIESFGTINMQAVEDLKENQIKLDELNNNINEINTAQNDLIDIINSLDKEVSKIFKNKIFEINKTLPSVFDKLFRNGKCELKFTEPDNLLTTGIDVIIKPENKQIRSLNVLSGGEKSIISLSILLTILKTSNFPLVILDEAESALDANNVESLAKLIRESTSFSQFLVVTHRKETMVECDKILGASQKNGVTSMFQISLKDAREE